MPCPSQFTLCHERWADMKPTECGRLCAKCDRELVDFTAMSEDGIRAYHMRNPGTCGLYSLSQFHKSGSRLAAAAAAAAIGLIAPAPAHSALQAPSSGMTQSIVEPADSLVVTGTVVDSVTSEPMIGALVVATGTAFSSVTDQNGQFRLVVRDPIAFPIRLQAQSIGYATTEAYVSADSLRHISFAMSPVMIGIVGIVVTGETRPSAPKETPSFWQRLWRALGGN